MKMEVHLAQFAASGLTLSIRAAAQLVLREIEEEELVMGLLES